MSEKEFSPLLKHLGADSAAFLSARYTQGFESGIDWEKLPPSNAVRIVRHQRRCSVRHLPGDREQRKLRGLRVLSRQALPVAKSQDRRQRRSLRPCPPSPSLCYNHRSPLTHLTYPQEQQRQLIRSFDWLPFFI